MGKYCDRGIIFTSFNPYFIGLPILIPSYLFSLLLLFMFQSLFYWITYSYYSDSTIVLFLSWKFQSLFYWITYSYPWDDLDNLDLPAGFQSLFYWITYSYNCERSTGNYKSTSFNPYFIGLPILILEFQFLMLLDQVIVSILILLDYLFLLTLNQSSCYIHLQSFNPYFIGLPILITKFYNNRIEKDCFNPYFIGLPILIMQKPL